MQAELKADHSCVSSCLLTPVPMHANCCQELSASSQGTASMIRAQSLVHRIPRHLESTSGDDSSVWCHGHAPHLKPWLVRHSKGSGLTSERHQIQTIKTCSFKSWCKKCCNKPQVSFKHKNTRHFKINRHLKRRVTVQLVQQWTSQFQVVDPLEPPL